jgi:hypothetical protein
MEQTALSTEHVSIGAQCIVYQSAGIGIEKKGEMIRKENIYALSTAASALSPALTTYPGE